MSASTTSKVLVVADRDGILEVFGPFAGDDELRAARSGLNLWRVRCRDKSVEVFEQEVHPSDVLVQWIADPASFYEQRA